MCASETKYINLCSLLKKKYIQLTLCQKNKTKIISELVDLIVGSAKAKDRRLFYNSLVEREKLGSTAIGGGVAIPHAKIEAVKKPMLAFGRSPEGVDFNSLDGEKTYIFFVLISPRKEVGTHLKILSKISHLVKDKFAVERFKNAKKAEEILLLLSHLEKGA